MAAKYKIDVVRIDKQLPTAEAKVASYINQYFHGIEVADNAFGPLEKSLSQIQTALQEIIDSLPQKNAFLQRYFYELSMNPNATELRVNKISATGDYLFTMFTITLK